MPMPGTELSTGSRSVKAAQKEPERLWRKGFVREMLMHHQWIKVVK